MARNIFRWLLMSSLLALVTGDEAPLPRGLTWSSKTYGPDGPWQAVAVSIGTPAQQIDLYPGGTWSSLILGSSNCDNSTISPVCYGKESGLFNADESYSVNRDIQYVPYIQVMSSAGSTAIRVLCRCTQRPCSWQIASILATVPSSQASALFY